jgi:hypothetical protein
MANYLLNAFLRRAIIFVPFPTISMSTTYIKRIMKSPSAYLFVNTVIWLWFTVTKLSHESLKVFVPLPRSLFQAV